MRINKDLVVKRKEVVITIPKLGFRRYGDINWPTVGIVILVGVLILAIVMLITGFGYLFILWVMKTGKTL